MSVVIPAHNEATVIGRLLSDLVASDPEGRLEIVVVANGCRDETARLARAASPRVTVVEIAETPKIAALNAGDAAATAFPRAYVDADVRVTADALLSTAAGLGGHSGKHVGAPSLTIDTSRASLPVRLYYRIWGLTDYRRNGTVGSGVYVLSAAGRSRFDLFPEVIADDGFVQRLYADEERFTPPGATFSVRAPRTFGAQLRRGTRIAAGNLQLSAAPSRASYARLVRRVARDPRLWPAFVVYAAGYSLSRARARRLIASGRVIAWSRDDTTRLDA